MRPTEQNSTEIREASLRDAFAETPEASAAKSPEPEIVLTFPTDGTVKEWHLTAEHIAKWRLAFPALDVLAECRKAFAWIDANPAKRKTAAGMKQFLVGWFGRAQNNGGGSRGANNSSGPGGNVGPSSRSRAQPGKYTNLGKTVGETPADGGTESPPAS